MGRNSSYLLPRQDGGTSQWVTLYERSNKLQLMDLILVLVEEEEDFVTKTFYYRETFSNDEEHINFYCP